MTQGYNVRANGIRQHLVRWVGPEGAPQLLLIPGITSPAVTWAFVAERLAERFEVHVLDVRGRGLSEAGDLDYSLDAMAADAEFAQSHSFKPPLSLLQRPACQRDTKRARKHFRIERDDRSAKCHFHLSGSLSPVSTGRTISTKPPARSTTGTFSRVKASM